MSRNDGKVLLGMLLAAVLAWGTGQGLWAAGGAAGGAAVTPTAMVTETPVPDSAAAPAAKAPAPQQKPAAAASDRQTTITDAAGRKHTRMKKVTPPERQAAAERLKARMAAAKAQVAAPAARTLAAPTALAAPTGELAPAGATQALALIAPGPGQTLPIPTWYKIADNGELIPDYSGATPNWANSPMPRLVPGAPVAVGNPLVARANPTDTASNVFVALATPIAAPGALQSFSTFNQPGSAGFSFHAYVLRPTGVASEYTVVFDSGQLSVPVLPAGSAGQVETYPVPAFDVLAGDLIAWYGQGVPWQSGVGNDLLCYPAPAPPATAAVITLGAGGFPLYPQARTYSFGATISDPSQATLTGGIRKFVNGLPGLGASAANNIGQYIPVAIPDQATYPGSDYYEIELGEYSERMHSDLPPTRLRGYRQTNTSDTTVSQFHYLGPLIVARKGRAVRVKFTNALPTGAAGNLFLPVDPTVMGAGPGPNSTWANAGEIDCAKWDPKAGLPTNGGAPPAACYTENRATIHLHGGVTPWISDGTTHQWITPAGESTAYPRGVSVYNVPDMPGPAKSPSPGVQTFYYTNDQSARLMFYHDHAHGITRLGVYAGEAAGYLLRDDMELALRDGGTIAGRTFAAGTIPADEVPLIIQDKTFVDATTIRQEDPTWNWGTGVTFTTLIDDNDTPLDPSDDKTIQLKDAVTGDLWWPHVYMPAQNPTDPSGMNAMGRWNYGPWFWPPTNNIPYGAVPNPYYDCNAFGLPDATHPCTQPWQPQQNPGTPNPSWGAEAFLDTPVINGTLYPTITVEPKAYRFRILDAAHDRFFNLQLYLAADKNSPTTFDATGAVLCDSGAVTPENCTEVKMVPAPDGREGGIPDPATKGPDWIQIGTEGGFLPKPVVIDSSQYVTWNGDPLTFNFGNVKDHSLLLGPAERADVIVDFSQYAGKTLILYNDAPAAFPALDPRNDYYTGNPDLRDQGGAPPTLPGYGPNTRTLMQIRVSSGAPQPFDQNRLFAAFAPSGSLPGVFQQSQDPVVVGQTAYNDAYGVTFPRVPPYWGISNIYSTSLSFMPAGVPCTDPDPVNCTATLPMKAKAIQDEMGETFDEYGRMRSSLGLTLAAPLANGNNFILQGYSYPPTELVKLSNIDPSVGTTLIGSKDDGTQIWKITHNGVDTHPVHFHLFHVQLINRVGWDNAIRLPDANELGWKDTVRISPLEDTIVALRPISPRPSILPWQLPNSERPFEPALPLGYSWDGFDPVGNPITITNQVANFGWEYIWHCHILSHEENDMMRAIGYAMPPDAPTTFTATQSGASVLLSWTIGPSLITNGFTIERSTDPAFPAAATTTLPLLPGTARNTTDAVAGGATYYYRLYATNTIGSSVPGYPTLTAPSPAIEASVAVVSVLPVAATGLVASPAATPTQVNLTWNYAQGPAPATGFLVRRAVNGGAFSTIATLNTVNAVNTYSDPGRSPGTTYNYQVVAFNANGNGPAASLTVQTPLVAPTNLRVTLNLLRRIVVSWSVASTVNTSNFRVYRSLDGVNWSLIATTGVATRTYSNTGLTVGQRYYYRVQAVNTASGAVSAFSNVVSAVAR